LKELKIYSIVIQLTCYSDTADKKDKDHDRLEGIRFENGTSDTHRCRDTFATALGITASDGVDVGETNSDTQKGELLQGNTGIGIRISHSSGDLAKQKISSNKLTFHF
jgi:hypothetical protein